MGKQSSSSSDATVGNNSIDQNNQSRDLKALGSDLLGIIIDAVMLYGVWVTSKYIYKVRNRVHKTMGLRLICHYLLVFKASYRRLETKWRYTNKTAPALTPIGTCNFPNYVSRGCDCRRYR